MTNDEALRAMQDQINAMKRRLDAITDDVPERPAEEHPDEALAQAIADAFHEGDSYDAARVAREHISEERNPVDVDLANAREGAAEAHSTAIYAEQRARKAEAEVERLTRERDEAMKEVRRLHYNPVAQEMRRQRDKAVKRHAALREDVSEFQYKHREYPGTWELVDALARDTKRGQAQDDRELAEAERDEWKARHADLRAGVQRWAKGRSDVSLTTILARDDERGQAQGDRGLFGGSGANAIERGCGEDFRRRFVDPAPDTVTLRRDDVESLLHCWSEEPDFSGADRDTTARVRAALGWDA